MITQPGLHLSSVTLSSSLMMSSKKKKKKKGKVLKIYIFQSNLLSIVKHFKTIIIDNWHACSVRQEEIKVFSVQVMQNTWNLYLYKNTAHRKRSHNSCFFSCLYKTSIQQLISLKSLHSRSSMLGFIHLLYKCLPAKIGVSFVSCLCKKSLQQLRCLKFLHTRSGMLRYILYMYLPAKIGVSLVSTDMNRSQSCCFFSCLYKICMQQLRSLKSLHTVLLLTSTSELVLYK